jgi:hypothetical protein
MTNIIKSKLDEYIIGCIAAGRGELDEMVENFTDTWGEGTSDTWGEGTSGFICKWDRQMSWEDKRLFDHYSHDLRYGLTADKIILNNIASTSLSAGDKLTFARLMVDTFVGNRVSKKLATEMEEINKKGASPWQLDWEHRQYDKYYGMSTTTNIYIKEKREQELKTATASWVQREGPGTFQVREALNPLETVRENEDVEAQISEIKKMKAELQMIREERSQLKLGISRTIESIEEKEAVTSLVLASEREHREEVAAEAESDALSTHYQSEEKVAEVERENERVKGEPDTRGGDTGGDFVDESCVITGCNYRGEDIPKHLVNDHNLGTTWYFCRENHCHFMTNQKAYLGDHSMHVHGIDVAGTAIEWSTHKVPPYYTLSPT